MQPTAPPPDSKPQDTYDLHACALKAQTALERLATELAHAGAPRNVTGVVTQMADATRQIVDFTGGKPPAASQSPAAPPTASTPQGHTMSTAANALVAAVAAKRAQGGQ